MKPSISTFVLTKKTGWYGAYSGYYERVAALLAHREDTFIIKPLRLNIWSKMIGRIHSRYLRIPVRNHSGSYAELKLRIALLFKPRARGIILNLDDHCPFLRWWRKAPRRLVGVIHMPPSVWSPRRRSDISRLSSAILPWRSALSEAETLVGQGRVRYVPHGIDTDFFCPGSTLREPDHLLFCGQFLRDFSMLKRVFLSLHHARPCLRLTLVVPPASAQHSELAWCAKMKGVTLLTGIDDKDLLALYQKCTALIIPLKDSGANNAIMEALACGLPIATNDIGGVRDYGGGSIFPVAINGNDASLIAIVEKYLDNPALCAQVSIQQRALAETFKWEIVLPMIETALNELTA